MIQNAQKRVEQNPQLPSRRDFIHGILALMGSATLLWIGMFNSLLRFFYNPRLAVSERERLLVQRVGRLRGTLMESAQELERLSSEYIEVAKLSDLLVKEGKYFIDYEMRPGLAFIDDTGHPILISAKCTHLGCTVGNKIDDKDRIPCPCHLSYFDIHTGQPNAGAPAKLPLAQIGWVLKDSSGQIVARTAPGKPMEGKPDLDKPELYTVCLAKSLQQSGTS